MTETLRDAIQKGASAEALWAIVIEIVRQLRGLHRDHMFHGCVCPETIQLEPTGLSKVALTEAGNGVPVHLLKYLAPERFPGITYSEAADVYSLAATMYELLRGNAPFSGDDLSALLAQKHEGPIAADVDPIILAALSPEPAARPHPEGHWRAWRSRNWTRESGGRVPRPEARGGSAGVPFGLCTARRSTACRSTARCGTDDDRFGA